MPRCSTIKQNLTAWIDEELPQAQAERVDLHLARCLACSGEAELLRLSIDAQRQTLAQLVAVAEVDATALFARVRRAMAESPAEPALAWWRDWSWTSLARPVPLALAAAAVLVMALVEVAGGPEDVLVPIGVKAPPAVVSHKPGMFRDYAIIEKLDALENFDTVEVEPLDDDQADQG